MKCFCHKECGFLIHKSQSVLDNWSWILIQIFYEFIQALTITCKTDYFPKSIGFNSHSNLWKSPLKGVQFWSNWPHCSIHAAEAAVVYELAVASCSCHNYKLPPLSSRERFRWQLFKMDPAEVSPEFPGIQLLQVIGLQRSSPTFSHWQEISEISWRVSNESL